MAFDFPSSPTPGQVYVSGGVTFTYNGYAWDRQGSGTGSGGAGFVTPEMFGGSVQAAVDAVHAANGGGEVRLRSLHALPAALMMRPNVRLTSDNGKGGVARVGMVVECVSYAAHGASLEGVIVDGGRTPTTPFDPNALAVWIGSSDDVTVDRCIIRNSNGTAVNIQTGMRSKVTRNYFTNVGAYAVMIARVTPAPNYALVEHNTGDNLGYHFVGIDYSHNNMVRFNDFKGIRTVGLVVNFNGTLVTRVSGPLFTGAPIFTCLISNYVSGADTLLIERQIMSVASDGQSCQINAPIDGGGVHNNRPAAFGTGDLYTVFCGNDNDFIGNTGAEGAAAGVSIADNRAYLTANNRFIDNHFKNVGQCGFLVAGDSPALVYGTKIIGNSVLNPGSNGAAGDVTANVGIYVFGGAQRTFLADNTFQDDQGYIVGGSATMQHGIAVGNTSDVILGGSNEVFNAVNKGIRNGAPSVVLSAGWGVGATVSNIVHHGNVITFRITAGTGATPNNQTITVNHIAGPASPQSTGEIQHPDSGTFSILYRGAFTKQQSIFYFFSTVHPVSSTAYDVTVRL